MSAPDPKRQRIAASPHPPSFVSSAAVGVVSPGEAEPAAAAAAAAAVPSNLEKMLVGEIKKGGTKGVVLGLKILYGQLVEDERKEKVNSVNETATNSGGPASVVAVMRKWQNNEEIQHWGCRGLCALAHDNSKAVTALAQSGGGMEVVVNAMKSFPHSPDVQYAGIWAIQNMLGMSTPDLSWPTKRLNFQLGQKFVQEQDGVALILHCINSCMNFYPDKASMLSPACRVLAKVHREEHHEMFLKSGVVATAGTILQKFVHHDGVKTAAEFLMEIMFHKYTPCVNCDV